MNSENNLVSRVLELVKFYYEIIFPTIYEYSTLLHTLGIKEYPEQLDYYKNDAFHDIAFALYDTELSYDEKLEKLANSKEHLILNGIEFIEYYVFLKLNRLFKRINGLKKIYKRRFFNKSIVYFESEYEKFQKNNWEIVKEQKSKNFDKAKNALLNIIKGIEDLEKIFIEPKKIISYFDELKKWNKYRKFASWFFGTVVLTGLILPNILMLFR